MREFTIKKLGRGDNKKSYAFMEFNSLLDYYNVIKDNDWIYDRYRDEDDSFEGEWVYGSHFKTKKEHYTALLNGQASPLMVNEYHKMRTKIENKLNLNQFYRQGMSCLRKRRFKDEGDEIDIDRYLGGTDNYWITHKRDKKSKNIRIALNFGLSASNSEAKFSHLVAVLGVLADMLTKLGFATEVVGCSFRRYSGERKLSYTSSVITFKRAGERLDLQRLLSMGLTGLLRDWEFGVGKMLKYDGTQGMQGLMTKELKEHLNINYTIEQHMVKDDNSILSFFNDTINSLVNVK